MVKQVMELDVGIDDLVHVAGFYILAYDDQQTLQVLELIVRDMLGRQTV